MIELEVLSHDGPARLGRLDIGGVSIPTPSACFFQRIEEGHRIFAVGEGSELTIAVPPTEGVARQRSREAFEAPQGRGLIVVENPKPGGRTAVPPGASLVLRAEDEIEGAELGKARLVIAEAAGMEPRHLVDWIVELRRLLSPNAALLLPDVEIWSFPLYALAGVDLFGDSHAWGGTLSGNMLFESFQLPWEPGEEGRCLCPFCARPGSGKAGLLSHNRWMTGKVLSEIRARIRIGEVKHLAEERALSHPHLATALKHLYRGHADYLEEHTTINPGVSP